MPLKEIRKTLHQKAEVSWKENLTRIYVNQLILSLKPDLSFEVGHGSLLYLFNLKQMPQAPLICFRADLDALPIEETLQIEHASRQKGVSHKCGHDGHMTVMIGLAERLHKKQKKFALLFQAAEEVGEGAKMVMDDPIFHKHRPDFIFGFHNIPGGDKNKIFYSQHLFACASTGLEIIFQGNHQHAAKAHKHDNALYDCMCLLENLKKMPEHLQDQRPLKKFSINSINSNTYEFGSIASEVKVGLTLRAENDQDLNDMVSHIKDLSKGHKINFIEPFPATINNLSFKIEDFFKANPALNNNSQFIQHPYSWSEDFGYYLRSIKGAYFGIGSGEDCLPLHHQHYDFPDDIIEGAVDFFELLYGWVY